MTHSPLEPNADLRAEWLATASRFVLDQLATIESARADGAIGPDAQRRAAAISPAISEFPLPGGLPAALSIVAAAGSLSLNTPGPGYLAFIPGGGLFSAAIADLISASMNRFTGLSVAAPGFCRLEHDVLTWLADSMGYDDKARGLFTSGGSLANLSAFVASRHRAFGDVGDLSKAIAYTSSQAHHSVAKSLRICGIPAANLREIEVDPEFRMDVDALETAVARDRALGLRPFLVIAAAGTTNTGAIDPLTAIADLCSAHGLWMHVDGAYGATFALSTRGRTLLQPGLGRADSITLDPHKGLFLPYGTGCLLVRDGAELQAVHSEQAAYLQDFEHSSFEVPSPGELGPELSRPYRGLRLWLALALHGAAAFREALDEKLALSQQLHRALTGIDGIEIVAAPQLSTVAFRLTRGLAESLEHWNRRNADLLTGINRLGRVYLSSTALPTAEGAVFTLRACVLSFRTHIDQIEACVADIAHLAASETAAV